MNISYNRRGVINRYQIGLSLEDMSCFVHESEIIFDGYSSFFAKEIFDEVEVESLLRKD